jgi:integrase
MTDTVHGRAEAQPERARGGFAGGLECGFNHKQAPARQAPPGARHEEVVLPMQADSHPSRPISGHVYLKRGKRGDQWYYRARLPRESRKRLGPAWEGRGRPPAGFFTRKTAEAKLQEILADARRGKLEGTTKAGATFADAAAEWLRYVEHDRKRKPSTVADYKGVVEHALNPELGDLPLEAVTSQRIESYRTRLVEEGKLSARTINKRLVVIHGILRRAMHVPAWGLRSNAAALVDRQPLPRSGDFSVLSPAEVEALARAAENEQDAALFTVAAFTGLRLGELRGLRWSDCAFAKHLVHVRRNYTHGAEGTPKSGRVRAVPLSDQAARALDGLSRRERFTDPDDLVFVDEIGGHVSGWRLRNRFEAALDRAGLPQLRFHDLRHTFGTLAVQGFPITDVKAFMGHADIATTMVYIHHVPQSDAAAKLSKLVAESSNVVPLPVSGHVRDTNAGHDDAPDTKNAPVAELSEWARLDSNQGPTDYESAALTS